MVNDELIHFSSVLLLTIEQTNKFFGFEIKTKLRLLYLEQFSWPKVLKFLLTLKQKELFS